MQAMFAGAALFDANVSGWDVRRVIDMSYLFSYRVNRNSDDVRKPYLLECYNSSFHGIGLDQWNTSQVQNMKAKFSGAVLLNADLSRWDVSSVDNMSSVFANTGFNADLSLWNTSQITNMSYLFYHAHNFSGIGLENWNVSSVQ
jgi:surface protein